MRIRDLLLELREVIDRHGNYGQWIDSNTKEVYPVENKFGHIDFIKERLDYFLEKASKTLGQKITKDFLQNDSEQYYALAFMVGFVRVAHERSTYVQFEGTSNALRGVSRIIMATAAQDDVDQIGVGIWSPQQMGEAGFKVFSLPEQRKELQNYLSML